MNKTKPKNLQEKHGIKFYKRWVILNIATRTVNIVRKYSEDNGLSMGKSLERIVDKSGVEKKSKHEGR